MRFLHRSGSTKEVAPGAEGKGKGLFGSKKRDDDFDLLASIDGADDARNDKSFAPKIFRRQSKNKDGAPVSPTSEPSTTSPLATLFQFKGNDETRESSPTSKTKQRKSKDKEPKEVKSPSAHPAMFQFKSRDEKKEKKEQSPKATSPTAAGAAVGTTSPVPSLFQLTTSHKDETTADASKHNRRNKKNDETSASPKTGATAGVAATAVVAAMATRPILRRRQSKDKLETEKETSTTALPTLFQFNNAAAATKDATTSSPKKSNKTATTAVAATGVVTTAAVIPALLSRMSFDRDDAKPAATLNTTHDETRDGASTSNRNPVLMAKLFPKQERKQIKVSYHNFSADAAHVVQVEQDDTPPKLVAPTHVLIKVQASTVTLNDCLLRRGFDFNVLSPLSLPLTPGYDVVGNIVEVGTRVAVDTFAVGNRVAAMVRTGGNARYLSVPYTSLVKLPSHLDSAEVAALVSIYTTAYQALRKVSGGSPMFSLEGKKVLILGGMDGAGQALIQMCKKARATIYATAPPVRHLYLKNVLGVHPLSETDWLSSVEGQLDYVFDGICEDGTEKSFKALKREGELVCYGHASMLKEREIGLLGAPFSARMNQFYTKMSFRVHTVDIWESFQNDPYTYKQDLKTLSQLLKWNKLKPHIAKRVSLAEVGGAQSKLENGDIRGTIVCLPWRPIRSGKITEGEDEV